MLLPNYGTGQSQKCVASFPKSDLRQTPSSLPAAAVGGAHTLYIFGVEGLLRAGDKYPDSPAIFLYVFS